MERALPVPRRKLGLELVLVVMVALAALAPGINNYSLVDPWETHYGEVSREMLQNHDWVHTDWQGTIENEGFRSKPVLQFWAMAASLRAFGLAENGGYSGELEHDERTMVAIRLPFILFATLGLVLCWWMLARLVDRKVAWLALLVVGSCPFYCLVARQAIPDMPLVATVMGALAMFLLACEDGERRLEPLWTTRWFTLDARHVLWLLVGGFLAIQAAYYLVYFINSPILNIRGKFPNPAVALPMFMAVMVFAISRDGWLFLRFWLFIWPGALISLALGEPTPPAPKNQTLWRSIFDNYVGVWERHALDRYVVRGILCIGLLVFPGTTWRDTQRWADNVMLMRPVTTARQVYLLWCYFFLGLGILAKGPPGLGVVGAVGVFHVLLLRRWRPLWDGFYDLKRGLIVIIVTFLPWHVAMYLKDGLRFIDEYLFTHILNRAAVGVDNAPGTFEVYTSQIGHGMWLWAGLLPAAFTAGFLRSSTDTTEGRVRFHLMLWAVSGAFFFSIVQTKFHHYILPVIPALGMIVAFFLRDVLTKRDRLHPVFALAGAGIVLLICRDLVFEPERWIEMFVFRYDRPWPHAEPWSIDPSDGFLWLGIAGAVAILVLATPWRRLGVACVGLVGIAICLWSLHAYMPVAARHWGMREAIRSYYKLRTVYGEKIVYFGAGELRDDWERVPDGGTWSFDTFVPDNLQPGQPMVIHVQVNRPDDERVMEGEATMTGTAVEVGDHTVTVKLGPGERKKLDPLVAKGANGATGRAPLYVVDADRLIGWQLYWRGETFWSGNELMSFLPEMKSEFIKTDNADFLKYLNDRTKNPLGRRTFLITEAGRANSTRSLLPTPHGKDTFEVIDTTSNKFTLVSFSL